MTEIARALQTFWGGFGLTAYPEDNVPEVQGGADNLASLLPYITYRLVQPEFGVPMTYQARVWYWSKGYEEIAAKTDEITAKIGEGIMLRVGPGYVCLRPDTPLVRLQPTEDYRLKVAYINLQINVYTK